MENKYEKSAAFETQRLAVLMSIKLRDDGFKFERMNAKSEHVDLVNTILVSLAL